MESMNHTPMANRFTVGLFGKRNAGKSSLINALTGQEIAVISSCPGTTTDPVTKAMELLPLGPIALIDTAGYDDEGELGHLRVEKTYEILRKCDLALVVGEAGFWPDQEELHFLDEIKKREIPVIYLLNKADQAQEEKEEKLGKDSTATEQLVAALGLPVMKVSALTGNGIDALKALIARQAPREEQEKRLMEGLIRPGEIAVLVVPLDKSAPKGRLILPQQQVIREILDIGGISMITGVEDLPKTLNSLCRPPAIVITDAQAFHQVAAATPVDVPLTSFSMIFARYKADLAEMIRGVKKVGQLTADDRVLIVEGCTHHQQEDDIGRVKIPQLIRKITGQEVQFDWASGSNFPKDAGEFSLLVHCGGCMLNQREMTYRMKSARESGTPITNYGVLMAYGQGILARALMPFGNFSG